MEKTLELKVINSVSNLRKISEFEEKTCWNLRYKRFISIVCRNFTQFLPFVALEKKRVHG